MITCKECKGTCCKEINIQIDTPETEDDYLDIFWYLSHPPFKAHIDTDGDWWIMIPTGCMHLSEDGGCRIYKDRPPVCRDSPVAECERNKEEILAEFRSNADYAKWLIRNKKISKEKIPSVFLSKKDA